MKALYVCPQKNRMLINCLTSFKDMQNNRKLSVLKICHLKMFFFVVFYFNSRSCGLQYKKNKDDNIHKSEALKR